MKKDAALVLCFAALLGGERPANADKWALPEEKTYFSPDNVFRFRVVPADLHALSEAGRPGCHGILEKVHQKGGEEYRLVWARPLVHRVSPAAAAVSADGRYVALFDNWHRAGYGPNAVTIYGEKGDRLRSFAVLDFLLEAEIRRLLMTVSSVWWYSDAFFDRGTLAIQVDQQDSAGKPLPSLRVRLDATTGKVLRSPADVRKLEEQRNLCRTFRGGRREEDWKACRAKMESDVWCALCGSLDER